MPNHALIPELAKLLLAIAWADGELHPEEEQTLKEVVGLMPPLSAQEWAVIELYLVTPITPQERTLLLQNVQALIRSAEDKRIALEAVDTMARADGTIDSQEAVVAHELHTALEAVDVSLLGLLRSVLARTTPPRREAMLQLWRSNPVLYLLRAQHPYDPELQTAEIEVAALAAGIMAQVACVTPATAEQERPVLIDALANDWNFPQQQAEQIAEAALKVARRNVDYQRIARELARRASEAQRVALLDTLFAIANAADKVSPREIDEIRVITDRINLTQQQFISAKLKIPAADRGGL